MPCWEGVSGRGETNVLSQERGYALSTCAAQTPERARCITDAVCGNYDSNNGVQSLEAKIDIQCHGHLWLFNTPVA